MAYAGPWASITAASDLTISRKVRKNFEKALSLSDRTSERERQVIRLDYEHYFGTYETARSLYEAYLNSYPDSMDMRYSFAILLRDHGETENAIKQNEEVLRIDPGHASAHINLATCYTRAHRTKDALGGLCSGV